MLWMCDTAGYSWLLVVISQWWWLLHKHTPPYCCTYFHLHTLVHLFVMGFYKTLAAMCMCTFCLFVFRKHHQAGVSTTLFCFYYDFITSVLCKTGIYTVRFSLIPPSKSFMVSLVNFKCKILVWCDPNSKIISSKCFGYDFSPHYLCSE